jgi:hypothetical protein
MRRILTQRSTIYRSIFGCRVPAMRNRKDDRDGQNADHAERPASSKPRPPRGGASGAARRGGRRLGLISPLQQRPSGRISMGAWVA